MDKRFKGIRLIGIIDLVLGFSLLLFLLYGAILWIIAFKKYPTDVIISGIVILFLSLFVSAVLIKLGQLTIKLSPQAISGNIMLAVFVIMGFLGSQLQHQSNISKLAGFSLSIYSIWVIFYLNRHKVKEQFKQ